jgi:uncharacterized protein YjiS (DUF1127 family)
MTGSNPVETYLQAFRDWRKRRAAIAELHALNDIELRDMGIGRCEIDSIVHFGGRDPTRLPRG